MAVDDRIEPVEQPAGTVGADTAVLDMAVVEQLGPLAAVGDAVAEEYGECLGLAFQIVDDILDITADEKLLGKPVHSDEEQNKSTYPAIFGLEAAKAKAAELTDRAMAAIEKLPDNGFITELTASLLKRQY